jgi:predicted nucleic acid-binding protein
LAIVLDSWALLALLRGEPAGELVREEWLQRGAAMCSLNLGEVLYLEMRARDPKDAGKAIEDARSELTVIDPDWDLVRGAAEAKAHGGLSYADAFCLATARRLRAPLWTGDPEILGRADEFDCEVVDLGSI